MVGVIQEPSLGLALEFLEGAAPLAGPPNFETVARDVYAEGVKFSLPFVLKVLIGVCDACGACPGAARTSCCCWIARLLAWKWLTRG